MPTWLKIILAIFLAFLVLLAAGAWLGYRWFQNNKDRIREQGQKTVDEGSAFGAGKTAVQCLDEAVARLDRDKGLMGEVRARLFFTACAKVASPSPELCANAPKSTEIMKTVQWSTEECSRRGRPNSQPCMRLMGEVTQLCEKAEASR